MRAIALVALVVFVTLSSPARVAADSRSDEAIAWAQSLVGLHTFPSEGCRAADPGPHPACAGPKVHVADGWCLAFVRVAFGATLKAGDPTSAYELWLRLGKPSGEVRDAPRGALVFFGPTGAFGGPHFNPYGHVGISLGNGTMISALKGAKSGVVVTPSSAVGRPLGWAIAPSEWPGRGGTGNLTTSGGLSSSAPPSTVVTRSAQPSGDGLTFGSVRIQLMSMGVRDVDVLGFGPKPSAGFRPLVATFEVQNTLAAEPLWIRFEDGKFSQSALGATVDWVDLVSYSVTSKEGFRYASASYVERNPSIPSGGGMTWLGPRMRSLFTVWFAVAVTANPPFTITAQPLTGASAPRVLTVGASTGAFPAVSDALFVEAGAAFRAGSLEYRLESVAFPSCRPAGGFATGCISEDPFFLPGLKQGEHTYKVTLSTVNPGGYQEAQLARGLMQGSTGVALTNLDVLGDIQEQRFCCQAVGPGQKVTFSYFFAVPDLETNRVFLIASTPLDGATQKATGATKVGAWKVSPPSGQARLAAASFDLSRNAGATVSYRRASWTADLLRADVTRDGKVTFTFGISIPRGDSSSWAAGASYLLLKTGARVELNPSQSSIYAGGRPGTYQLSSLTFPTFDGGSQPFSLYVCGSAFCYDGPITGLTLPIQ